MNEVIRAAAALQAVCVAEQAQLAPLVELKEAPEILRQLDQRRRQLDP